MSSFFTLPKSQKKRKRADEAPQKAAKRSKPATADRKKANPARDESISGSDDEEEPHAARSDLEDQEGSSSEDETAAERRLRLAEQYLKNIKGEVQDEIGFDAEEIDRDLIAERLQEDVDESKGRLHRFVASEYDYATAIQTHFRMKGTSIYGAAASPPFVYTVSRDSIVTKWHIPDPPAAVPTKQNQDSKPKKPPKSLRSFARRPIRICEIGPRNAPSKALRHTAPILAVAASPDGKYLVTGGQDKKVILYSTSAAEELLPIKSFVQHRDAVTSVCFRPGTNQFFSASRDRTVKVWSADERAYVETLFGHQDEVVDVAAFPTVERCASVGARDRTARVWKVVEETQLVFRGGGGGSGKKELRNGVVGEEGERKVYLEGSIDRIAVVDNDTFVTGSDNGSLCLWGLQKKKPLFTYPMAHGLDESMDPHEFSAELQLGPDFRVPERQPRWVTALKVLPLSNLVITGSWDGCLRLWKIGESKKTIEILGTLGQSSVVTSGRADIRGVVNGIEAFERGEKGKEILYIVAAIGKEHRLGRWKRLGSRGGSMTWAISKRLTESRQPEVNVNMAAVEGQDLM